MRWDKKKRCKNLIDHNFSSFKEQTFNIFCLSFEITEQIFSSIFISLSNCLKLEEKRHIKSGFLYRAIVKLSQVRWKTQHEIWIHIQNHETFAENFSFKVTLIQFQSLKKWYGFRRYILNKGVVVFSTSLGEQPQDTDIF